MPLMGRILSSIYATLIASLHLMTPASAQEVIRIGIIAPLTGPLSFYSQGVFQGAKAAQDNIGSRGILDRKLEIVVMDDSGNPSNSASTARTLVDSMGVRFVIGHFTRETSLAAAAFYSERKVLHLEPRRFRLPPDSPVSDTRFSLCGGESSRGEVLKDYLTKQLKANQVGMVGEDGNASRALSRLANVLKNVGVKIVGPEDFNLGGMQGSFSRVENRGAEAIVVRLNGESYTSKLQNLSQVSTKLPIVLDVAPNVPTGYMPSSGASNTKNLFLLQEIDQGVGLSQPPSELAAFREASAYAGNNFLLGYAAIQVIAKGIEGSRSLEPDRVAAWLRSGQASPTILGEVKFDRLGDASIPQFAIYGFAKGTLRPDGTEVTCDTGCPCKDGGCGCECRKK